MKENELNLKLLQQQQKEKEINKLFLISDVVLDESLGWDKFKLKNQSRHPNR